MAQPAPNLKNTAIILFAHGSQVSGANEEVQRVAVRLGERVNCPSTAAFLDQAPPDLTAAIAGLVARGINRVIIIPYFLTMGTHISRDLPALANRETERYQGLSVELAAPMEGHPQLLDILLDRMREASPLAPK